VGVASCVSSPKGRSPLEQEIAFIVPAATGVTFVLFWLAVLRQFALKQIRYIEVTSANLSLLRKLMKNLTSRIDVIAQLG